MAARPCFCLGAHARPAWAENWILLHFYPLAFVVASSCFPHCLSNVRERLGCPSDVMKVWINDNDVKAQECRDKPEVELTPHLKGLWGYLFIYLFKINHVSWKSVLVSLVPNDWDN